MSEPRARAKQERQRVETYEQMKAKSSSNQQQFLKNTEAKRKAEYEAIAERAEK